jgi:S1-C subfamily serine protease
MLRRSVFASSLSLILLAAAPVSPAEPAPQPKSASQPKPVPTATTVTRAGTPSAEAPAAVAPAVAPAPSAPPSTVERARQGVVVIQRVKKPLALGIVLDGDGRILTALSALAHGNYLSARYHDGSEAALKLQHGDRGWDLALLVPDTHDKKAGVRAAALTVLDGAQLMQLTPPNAVTTAPASLKAAPALLGGDGKELVGAYELGARPNLAGAPIVNPQGEVVALVARACPAESGARCTPAPYGVPVAALKQFLRSIPASADWLGIQAASDETGAVRGVRVVSVAPASPAASAGLRAGKDAASADLIVAVNGAPVASPAELNQAVGSAGAGSIELLLFGFGRYRQVALAPRPAPAAEKAPASAPAAPPAPTATPPKPLKPKPPTTTR